MTKERVNYVISPEGKYVGYSVNLPFIVGQADSLEDLNNSMKEILKIFLEDYQKLSDSGDPFEYKQVDGNTFMGNTVKTKIDDAQEQTGAFVFPDDLDKIEPQPRNSLNV